MSELVKSVRIKPTVVNQEDSIWSVAQKMRRARVGIAFVLKDGRIVGFYSEKIHQEASLKREALDPNTPVGELMSQSFYYSRPDDSLEDCVKFMRSENLRNLPVVFDGELKAVVTLESLVEKLLDEKSFLIRQLEEYISGAPGGHAIDENSKTVVLGKQRLN